MLKRVQNTDQYVFETVFGIPFVHASAKLLNVRIVLPEGATNIQYTTSFEVTKEHRDSLMTYLTTAGRPVLELQLQNVVAGHYQPITVTYTLVSQALLRGPLILVSVFIAIFMAIILLSHLDLSLGEGSVNIQVENSLSSGTNVTKSERSSTVSTTKETKTTKTAETVQTKGSINTSSSKQQGKKHKNK